jgi:hypothetical protein
MVSAQTQEPYPARPFSPTIQPLHMTGESLPGYPGSLSHGNHQHPGLKMLNLWALRMKTIEGENPAQRPRRWPVDLEDFPVIFPASTRTGYIIFFWSQRGHPLSWLNYSLGQKEWVDAKCADDLPNEVRYSTVLRQRLGHLSYWQGTLKPAIFVSAACTLARTGLTAMVKIGFESWWQLHKGRLERTFWRQPAWAEAFSGYYPPLPGECAAAPARCALARPSRTPKWRIKGTPRWFDARNKGALDFLLAKATLTFLGLKGYRVTRTLNKPALACLTNGIPQLRQERSTKKAQERLRQNSLSKVLTTTTVARNNIMELVLDSFPCIFQACRDLRALEHCWGIQLWQVSPSWERTVMALNFQGVKPNLMQGALLRNALIREAAAHEDSGDEASDMRHRLVELS